MSALAALPQRLTFPYPLSREVVIDFNSRLLGLLSPDSNPRTDTLVAEQLQSLFKRTIQERAALLFPNKKMAKGVSFRLYFPNEDSNPKTLHDAVLQIFQSMQDSFRLFQNPREDSFTRTLALKSFQKSQSILPLLGALAGAIGLRDKWQETVEVGREITFAGITGSFRRHLARMERILPNRNTNTEEYSKQLNLLKQKREELLSYAPDPDAILRVIEPEFRALLESEIKRLNQQALRTDSAALVLLAMKVEWLEESFIDLLGALPEDPLLLQLQETQQRVLRRSAELLPPYIPEEPPET